MAPPPRTPRGPKTREKPATEAREPVFRGRARGALLGLAVGEAMGVHNEFRSLSAAPFPTLNEVPTDELRGGGPFELKKGQVSWGTQLAVALANSLREERSFGVHLVGKAYARWLPCAFAVGETTKLALDQIADGRSGEFSGRRVWLENAQRPKENDALVRSVPLAVFFARQRTQRLEACLDEAAITHFAPVCRMASAVLNGVISAALLTPKEALPRADLPKLLETELSAAASALGRREPDWVQATTDAAECLREDLRLAQREDPELYGPELHLFQQASWARVTFRLALWELFHAPDYRAAVLDVVNRGGDADTNAAVTGALFGALYGEAAIPQEWRETVLEALQYTGGPLWNVYHPRYLLNLVGVTAEAPTPE